MADRDAVPCTYMGSSSGGVIEERRRKKRTLGDARHRVELRRFSRSSGPSGDQGFSDSFATARGALCKYTPDEYGWRIAGCSFRRREARAREKAKFSSAGYTRASAPHRLAPTSQRDSIYVGEAGLSTSATTRPFEGRTCC